MGLSSYGRRRLETGLASLRAADEVEQYLTGNRPGTTWFVDTWQGNANNNGKSWREPFLTMDAALTAAATMDTIYFKGDVREQLTGSNIKYDITIIGVGSLHHPDDLLSEDYGSCMWRLPASGAVETTPLLIVRGRGWKFINIAFDGPATAAAVQLVRTAEGASEYDASHASFIGCRFFTGRNHIEDNGGVSNLTIRGCEFRGATAFSILNVSGAGVGTSLNWKIVDNFFMPDDGFAAGNAGHIDAGITCGVIVGNVFGKVTSTGLYVDLTGGINNVVSNNIMCGEYETSNYKGGTTDFWSGNTTAADASTSAVSFSILVPD